MRAATKIKKIQKYQCQVCGDWQGRKYDSGVIVEAQAHHIIPKSECGQNTLENLITLCDFCHAVMTPQRWKEYFGYRGTPQNMEWIRKEFNGYLKSEIEEKEKIKSSIWDRFGIRPR